MAKPVEIVNPHPGGSSFTSQKQAEYCVGRGRAVWQDGKLLFICRGDRPERIPFANADTTDKSNQSRLTRKGTEKQTAGVYVLRSEGGLYKIGRTTNLNKRLIALWSMIPGKIEIFAFLPTSGSIELEWSLHQEFATRRRKGEWFELAQEDVVSIVDRGFLLINQEIEDYLKDKSRMF